MPSLGGRGGGAGGGAEEEEEERRRSGEAEEGECEPDGVGDVAEATDLASERATGSKPSRRVPNGCRCSRPSRARGHAQGGEQTAAMAPATCDRGRCVRSWRKSFSARVSAARWNHEACVAWLVPFQGSGRGTTVVGVAGSWCVGSTLSPRGGRGPRGFRELRVSSGHIARPLVIAAVREAVSAARRGSLHTQCFVRRTDQRPSSSPPLLRLLLFSASPLRLLLLTFGMPNDFDGEVRRRDGFPLAGAVPACSLLTWPFLASG